MNSIAWDYATDIVASYESFYRPSTDKRLASRYNISSAVLADYRASYPKDTAMAETVEQLSLEQAERVWQLIFWQPLMCNSFNPAVALAVFDNALIAGCEHAIKWLQHELFLPATGEFNDYMLQRIAASNAHGLVREMLLHRFSYQMEAGDFQKDLTRHVRRILTIASHIQRLDYPSIRR